jgi:hypothetical protein
VVDLSGVWRKKVFSHLSAARQVTGSILGWASWWDSSLSYNDEKFTLSMFDNVNVSLSVWYQAEVIGSSLLDLNSCF